MKEHQPPAGPPAWHGTPRDELPTRFPFGLTFVALLQGRDGFPAGEVLSDTLCNGAAGYIRGGEIETDAKGDTSVVLWVPAFKDQQGYVRDEEEQAEHTPLREIERWQIAEMAFAALGAAMPDTVVRLGFLTADGSVARPWNEYCRHYRHPPEFAFAFWDHDGE
jgi:PAS domain-containing protein